MPKKIRLPKAAKDLLKRGFSIFPTPAGQKGFFGGLKWRKESSSDPQVVSDWALSREYRGCNWAVDCGKSGLMVLDIDGLTGEESLRELELVWGVLPPTLTVRTASGGRHLYYRGSGRSTVSVGWPGSKLDTRSVGGLVFAPGSVIGDGRYKWEVDREIEDCPDWVLDLVGEARIREMSNPVVLAENTGADIAKGRAWLGEQDPAIEGQGGDSATFKIMQMLRDFGLSVEKCAEIVFESEWNQRCEPPWDLDELLVKARNAATYSWGDQGSRSVVVDFEDEAEWDGCEDDEPRVVMDPLLVDLNGRHSKQLLGGKVIIWAQQAEEGGSLNWIPLAKSDFDSLYEHQLKEVGDRMVPVGRWWRTHPKHMRSSGIILDPDRPSGPTGLGKDFNIWCGWGIRPGKGEWVDYEKLVVEALCGGVESYAKYVLDWCALLVQRPTELPKTALVFRGRKGTGKSTLGLALCDAFGSHAVKVDRLSAVTGQFNWHLKNKVFLLAEEIRWLSERGAEGVLKSLITDWRKGYESKGVNMIDGYNYLSVMINSNSDWVIPASAQDERRFAVFDVCDCLQTNTRFWNRMYDGRGSRLREDKLAAFIGALKRRDIRGFDPIREVPQTEALRDQAVASLDYVERWWYSKIEDGLLPGIGEDWGDFAIEIPSKVVYHDYANGAGVPRERIRSQRAFGRYMARFGAERIRLRDGSNGRREYVYKIPSLRRAKAQFFSLTPVGETDE